jgi:protein TonB
MSLNTMALKGMDRYGSIELFKNANKLTVRGFLTALSFIILLVLLYIGVMALTTTEEKAPPRIKIKSLTDLAPPPSTQDASEPMAMAAPAPADIARPTFGIPVPVPDAIAPQAVMPDLNTVIPTTIGDGIGSGGVDAAGIGDKPVEIKAPVQVIEEDPGKDEFVAVEVEPSPIVNIQSLVKYPDVARRTGLEGKVIASVLIDKEGRVKKVEIEKSDYEIFNDAAREALMKARFTPARQNGEPVSVWFTLPIVFKMAN